MDSTSGGRASAFVSAMVSSCCSSASVSGSCIASRSGYSTVPWGLGGSRRRRRRSAPPLPQRRPPLPQRRPPLPQRRPPLPQRRPPRWPRLPRRRGLGRLPTARARRLPPRARRPRRSPPPHTRPTPRSPPSLPSFPPWRRTSYSDITAAAHEARVASEPEEAVVTDEPEDEPRPATLPAAPRAARARPRPPTPRSPPSSRLRLAAGPGGTAFGTFAHTVFEATDFAAPDLDAELARTVAAALARRPVDIGDRATVDRRAARRDRDAARAARRRPAGCATSQRADRLDELTFELPLAGGDEPTGRAHARARSARSCASTSRPAIRSPGYADRLDDPELRASVRGYLTGSIDLVVRVGEAFAIADYKTNWLAAPGRGADRVAPPPGGAHRRDGARPLRPAGAALHGGAAPLPALAAAPATTPSATSPACSTCSCAG